MRTLNKSADLVSEGGAVAAAEILGNINPESRAPADGVLRLGTLLVTDCDIFFGHHSILRETPTCADTTTPAKYATTVPGATGRRMKRPWPAPGTRDSRTSTVRASYGSRVAGCCRAPWDTPAQTIISSDWLARLEAALTAGDGEAGGGGGQPGHQHPGLQLQRGHAAHGQLPRH